MIDNETPTGTLRLPACNAYVDDSDIGATEETAEAEALLDAAFDRLITEDGLRRLENDPSWDDVEHHPRKQYSHSMHDVHGGWSMRSQYRHAAAAAQSHANDAAAKVKQTSMDAFLVKKSRLAQPVQRSSYRTYMSIVKGSGASYIHMNGS